MKLLTKMFDREQAGWDQWQWGVVALAAALQVGTLLVASTDPPQEFVFIFPFTMSISLLALNFSYLAGSIIMTRGNWRQYCVCLLLSFVFFAAAFLFVWPLLMFGQ